MMASHPHHVRIAGCNRAPAIKRKPWQARARNVYGVPRMGTTQGRGKLDHNHTAQLPRKDIWLYPLTKDFRRLLSS